MRWRITCVSVCVYVYSIWLKTLEFLCAAGASVQDSHFLGPLMNERLLFNTGSYFTLLGALSGDSHD